jgi:hypothetical protein
MVKSAMAEPDNMVLNYLRRLDEKLDRLVADVTEMKQRLTSMEGRFASVERQIAPPR